MNEEFYLFDPPKQPKSLKKEKIPQWQLDAPDATVEGRLFWWIEKDNVQYIEDGYNAGVPLKNVYSVEGFTPLTYAALKGAENVLNKFLEWGLNPAFIGTKIAKFNAFHAAGIGGHLNIVLKLLAEFPDKFTMNMVDNNERKQTILHHALRHHQFDLALTLIEKHQASMELGDYRGRNALSIALGGMFVKSYDTDLKPNNRVSEWEDFCLALISKKNPFEGSQRGATSHFFPPIMAILSPDLALQKVDNPKLFKDGNAMSTEDAIAKVMMEAPMLATTLYWKARQNSAGELENQFITHYNKILQTPIISGHKKKLVSPEQIALLNQHLKDLEANKPLSRPVSASLAPMPSSHASTSTK